MRLCCCSSFANTHFFVSHSQRNTLQMLLCRRFLLLLAVSWVCHPSASCSWILHKLTPEANFSSDFTGNSCKVNAVWFKVKIEHSQVFVSVLPVTRHKTHWAVKHKRKQREALSVWISFSDCGDSRSQRTRTRKLYFNLVCLQLTNAASSLPAKVPCQFM